MNKPKPKATPPPPILLVVVLIGCLMLAMLSLLLGFVIYVVKSESPWLFVSAAVTFCAFSLCCCGITAGPPWIKGIQSWWSKT